MSAARARVGCSGYRYAHWRGILYPRGLPEARWLPRYAECFDTVELRSHPFHRLPSEGTVRRWAERVPPGFAFAVKLSRHGTHMKRLLDAGDWLPTFLGRIELLGAALGPVLVQLPPRMRPDPERLARFLQVAPRRHRRAVEFRDPRRLTPRVLGVLRDAGAALCVHDLLPGHPGSPPPTGSTCDSTGRARGSRTPARTRPRPSPGPPGASAATWPRGATRTPTSTTTPTAARRDALALRARLGLRDGCA